MPNKPRGIGIAWLDGKSYNIGVVYVTDPNVTAGSASKGFEGHIDYTGIHLIRTNEISRANASFRKINISQIPVSLC